MPHQNFINDRGEAYPSATELTRLLPQPWLMAWYKNSVKKHGWRGWLLNLATSNRGKKDGSDTHHLIECRLQGISNNPVSKRAHPLADALLGAVKDYIVEYIALEPHVISHEFKIAGTADMIVKLKDGALAIGDWKTSYLKSDEHPIQLAIYALAWNEQHPNDPPITKGFIVRVDKKSKKLNTKIDEYSDLNLYYPVIKALRLIYDYYNHTNSWEKPNEEH